MNVEQTVIFKYVVVLCIELDPQHGYAETVRDLSGVFTLNALAALERSAFCFKHARKVHQQIFFCNRVTSGQTIPQKSSLTDFSTRGACVRQ